MRGAPIGPVKTLPDDWIARVQAYQPSGPAALFAERVKAIVTTLGEKSIALRQVQELALAACGLNTATPFVQHSALLSRLAETCRGNWPVEEPWLDYKMVKKPIEAFDRDFRSIEAEWLVLDRLINEFWIPIPIHRDGTAMPDWKVGRPCRTLVVDAKHKPPMRLAHMLLTWVLRGLALLPGWRFLRDYSWDWSVHGGCRDQVVTPFVDQLFAGRADLLVRLQTPLTYHTEQIAGAPGLTIERFDDRTFTLFFSSNGETLNVTASPSPQQAVFNPGGVQTATIEDVLTDSTLDEFTPVLGRVGLDKGQRSLRVVVWQVPFAWEPIYNGPKIERWWQRACEARGWSPAVLWPVGGFEVRRMPWEPDAAAKKLLGCDLAPVASVLSPQLVVRFARLFLDRSGFG